MREIAVDVLVAEVGSTTTVVNAFRGLETDQPTFAGQGMAPTSVGAGDVTLGLRGAITDLSTRLGGNVKWEHMLATSSAAGGLRMTVHGLAYDMTARAAKEAALGAGALIKLVTAGKMSQRELAETTAIKPNIVLLAGGVDHGERDTAITNAHYLAQLEINAPIIYAGNISCREEVLDILRSGHKTVIAVDNVYPRIDELNIEPTRSAIQDVFEAHIVHAPGMSKIRDMVLGSIMPTPGAVMSAARLLSSCIGDLLVVDVGGATTDVHSVTAGSEEMARLMVSPEPVAKRTVEGDLGVYINAAQVGVLVRDEEMVMPRVQLDQILHDWPPIPTTEDQFTVLNILTGKAVEVALDRHVGRLKHLYGPGGRTTVAQGKDLTAVRWVVGTGGPLTTLNNAHEILSKALRISARQELYPKNYKVIIDCHYNMAVLGVLGREYPEAALCLMKQSLGMEGNNA
ncbi:MAG TPA: GlmL-related ornithine degradation protein [Bacillota bacterium]|nr:GlmL-related ornithine degradation protein [Bacillota bacterium]